MPRSPPLGFAVLAPSARDNSVGILRAFHAYTSRPVVLNTRCTLWAGRASGQWHWVEAGPAQRRPGDFPSTSPWPRGSRGSSGSPGLASTPAAPAHNSPGPSAQPCCTREGGRTLGCHAALASIGNTCSGGWGHGISHAGRPPAPMPLLPAGHTWGLSRVIPPGPTFP